MRTVKTIKPEPEAIVIFEPGRIIVVRTDDVVTIPFSQWPIILKAVRKHLKALAVASRKPRKLEEIEQGYADWLSKHLDDPGAPVATTK